MSKKQLCKAITGSYVVLGLLLVLHIKLMVPFTKELVEILKNILSTGQIVINLILRILIVYTLPTLGLLTLSIIITKFMILDAIDESDNESELSSIVAEQGCNE